VRACGELAVRDFGLGFDLIRIDEPLYKRRHELLRARRGEHGDRHSGGQRRRLVELALSLG
jgi:hypothetical protein